jgi:hypothetical protein
MIQKLIRPAHGASASAFNAGDDGGSAGLFVIRRDRLPDEPEDVLDPQLYHHLRRANELYTLFDAELVLALSPLTRVPLLGALWKRLRPSLQLILLYVNRLGAQQANVNRHLVSVLESADRAVPAAATPSGRWRPKCRLAAGEINAMRFAIVVPRYGPNILGGAETLRVVLPKRSTRAAIRWTC